MDNEEAAPEPSSPLEALRKRLGIKDGAEPKRAGPVETNEHEALQRGGADKRGREELRRAFRRWGR